MIVTVQNTVFDTNNFLNQSTHEPSGSGQVNAPDSVTEVAQTLRETLLDIWKNFLEHTPYLLAGILVLILTWVIANLFSKLGNRLFNFQRLRRSLRDLIIRLIIICIWIAGLLMAAMFWFPGLTPTTALGGLGIVSIAIGFAFQDIFENFFAGILLLWRFPFENGDFIECQGITGKVENVNIRMTEIRLTSGELILIPNSTLFKNPVTVLTNKPYRRVTIITGVAYGENVSKAVQVIEQAVKKCHTVALSEPVEIFPQAFGASSIDIEVAWWTENKPVDIRRSRGEIITAIKTALDDASIEIPFPYRTLTFKEPLTVHTNDKTKQDISDL
ncbi:mechanosensitive ion channel family protein [Nitrosomonas marina]|uniref:Small-conductance mechanosensitive channel n=1 Tax=Nitrosomonas marina TaxID=917 RepID=A0A1H8E3L0_9PROT|nr:mechanosensitive ion channel family protein [Nitrosomonas marina]SEN14020.1 Small-conductance mechanosensitive channel [Nitrosomonas marina]